MNFFPTFPTGYMEHPREMGKNVYLFHIKSQNSYYFIIQPLCLLFRIEIEMERSDASTFCRLNFAQMLWLLFNFILLSTFIGVVSNGILILEKETPLDDEKWLYGFTQKKQFKLILSSVEVKSTVLSSKLEEFMTKISHLHSITGGHLKWESK